VDVRSKLDQFRSDYPFDVQTQARRLASSGDDDLIVYVLALGLQMALQRQRHMERSVIKNTGMAPQRERFGSIKIVPSKKARNAMRQMILDVWRINGGMALGDATGNDLAIAIDREEKSANGHTRNAKLYRILKAEIGPNETVRSKWDENSIRDQIENVYGEFRQAEVA
jgi:hypothetical protein